VKRCWRQAATNYRLAACAPQKAKYATSVIDENSDRLVANRS
jgi:hypothetical protein